MKQEELFKSLIRELFGMEELHQEYQDNDTHFVIDTLKDGNILNIRIQLLENKDKKEFENWLSEISDDFFSEILDELKEKEGLFDLESLYNSKDYRKVINRVKSKAKEIAARKIKDLQRIVND